MNTFLNKTIKAYLGIALAIYFFLFVFWNNLFSYYNMLNLVVFASYAFLLYVCSYRPDEYFTKSRLSLTVFVYLLFFVIQYLSLSDYYTGNTMMFSEMDAKAYLRHSSHLANIPLSKYLVYLKSIGWGYDDWGAPVVQSFLLTLVPSKLFVNFCYIVIGTIGACALFDIGRSIMQVKYAYIASLSYSVASYSLFFCSSFLKEAILVFIVIESFWFLYKYFSGEGFYHLFIGLSISLLLFFFRPPIAVFIWIAVGAYFIMQRGNNANSAIALLVIFVIFSVAYSLVIENVNRYTSGGDITRTEGYVKGTRFTLLVSALGSLIGPFPEMFSLGGGNLSYKALFGAGLLFKYLLLFPFWKGFMYCIRARHAIAYPLFVFAILEMSGLALVADGLELRKALPHIPIYILAAFWWMSEYDEDVDELIYQTRYYVWSRRIFNLCVIFILFTTIVWNTARLS